MSRIDLRPPTPAERQTLRALGARHDDDGWWVDDTWPDLRRFDRWLPTRALIADVQRTIATAEANAARRSSP